MARTPILTAAERAVISGEVQRLNLLGIAGRRGRVRGGDELLRAIASRVSPLVPAGGDPLADCQLLYVEAYATFLESQGRTLGTAKNSADQSWRSASGSFYQAYIQDQLNVQIASQGMLALTEPQLRGLAPLVEFLKLPAKRRCLQSSINVWPDNDIILVTRSSEAEWRAVGILSCKTSLRERVFESAFWTLATRDTGLRSGFVTADLDHELDQCGGDGKNRQIVVTYFDRAYSTNPTTKLCAQVRPFKDAPADVLRWQRDVVANPMITPIHYRSGSWDPSVSLANSQ